MTGYRPLLDPQRPPEHFTNEHLAQAFVADLDRCEHGRHKVDNCSMCADERPADEPVPESWAGAAQSRGNPRARGEDPRTFDGRPILGFDIGGRPYVLMDPDPVDRAAPVVVVMDREAWAR